MDGQSQYTTSNEESKAEVLGTKMLEEYQEAENARSMTNLRWLDDLMQYRGQYTSDMLKVMKENRKSSVYYRLTTQKVNTMTARLMDLLFPSRTKNWSIEATPDPDIPQDVIMHAMEAEIAAEAQQILAGIMQQLAAENTIPDDLAMQKLQAGAFEQAFQQFDTPTIRLRVAKDRAAEMDRVIDDQLKEASANGQRRPSWQQNCRSVVKSSCLYGMGVLKGPLVEKIVSKQFKLQRDEYGQSSWSEQPTGEVLRPYHEAVSVWDVFPDPAAVTPAELRYVWQIHRMSDKDLHDLSTFPHFKSARIRDYIREHPEGDASLNTWETMMAHSNEENINSHARVKNRYRVYERWGFISGQDLFDAGVEVEDTSKVYSSNIWLLGDKVIKCVINPLEGVDIPYYFYPFQKDETSFWPEGIASTLRCPQSGINSVVRAMQDNAALSSGPIIGINVTALDEGENVHDMAARKMFLFSRSGQNLQELMQTTIVPSAIEHNLTLSKFWQEAADEQSTPRFNTGDGRISGAGETASGLSMLMGASNIMLKDHVKDFDDNVVSPFIRAMFRWNMQFNENNDIKGDYEIVASGSQSLITKEVRAQQLPMLIQMLNHPKFEPRIKADQLLEVALEQTDLPADRLIRTDEETKEYEQQQMLAQAQAQVQAMIMELEKRGMPEEMIQMKLLMLTQATMQQQQAVEQQQQAEGMQQ
ncbi:MAG: hypothetical protein LBR82_02040 [Desulfovibrio sp.]|jgi:hypothetical protein|nr:hypothetical protein [Desulfovibrio sp.]